MSDTPTLLRELIDIPERVQTNDFVLKLSEGVSDAEAAQTIRNYVVTPQLARAFDHALGFIQGAVERNRSAASYLHGSFGSGKSHFMAVLDLLLAGNVRARAIPELAGPINSHDRWMAGKKFLMVPYHMIGARDVESAILGGYAEHVRRLHPGAPIPAFYLGERLFDDARGLRSRIGDAAFFRQLNEGKQDAGDGWGDFGAAWDAQAFEAAMLEPPEGEERQRLVGDLIATFFTSYADVAVARGEAFVDLDTGLAIMSHHARQLGYDAVVLFLDELILWLATRAGDVDFVSAEGAKLSKLVEAQRADRPIPIISFVARQRDLRELIGEHQAGALEVRFIDTLKYWEARFDRITLEDRNLPVIAERRLLKPKSEAAKQELDAAFDSFARSRKDVVETLLGSEGERGLFRMTYPFSPALVQALIAASSVLQRERTALKLMLTLLVKRRDTLRLGALIPVGDLWDEISAGDQPFSEGMRIEFENARKLWTQKLLPLLEQVHGVSWQELQEDRADPQRVRLFENDARLLKTLLLAALVPEVEALRALTSRRLAALNHGSVLSPIPGREGTLVTQRLRSWAARVGEIRVGEEADPLVSVQITGVDIEPILANAAQSDNDGTRRTRLQRLVFGSLGLPGETALQSKLPFLEYTHAWRGTKRQVDLEFEVVKELPYDRLRGRGAPVLVLGMPLDPKGRPPRDHIVHAGDFRHTSDDGASGGVVWQPSYLSGRALKDLGTLVRIDYLLAGSGDRLLEAARHLSASDREQARAVLRSQQSALHERLRACVEAAYGIRKDADGYLDDIVQPEEQLVSLDMFRPRMPVGATMKDAIGALLDSWFDYRFPGHPKFDEDVTQQRLNPVLQEVYKAALEPDQRILMDRQVRDHMRAIAVPLQLGAAGQTHFQLSSHWADHFARMQARTGASGPMTVKQLREWMNEPQAMGLQEPVQNLVVLAFAAQADRTLLRRGAPTQASVDRVEDEVELHEQPLPDETIWERARERAGALFGLAPGEVRKGATVARLAAELKAAATERRPVLTALAQALQPRCNAFDVPTSASRLVTLRSAQTLLADLLGAGDPLALVTTLANAELATSEAAVQRCLGSAAGIHDALNNTNWDIISAGTALSDTRRAASEALRTYVAEALEADEHVIALAPVLSEATRRASRLLQESVRPVTPPSSPVVPPQPSTPPPPPPGEEVIEERQAVALGAADAAPVLEQLRDRMASTPGARLTLTWRLTRPKTAAGE
jgi:hypothetical protein